MTRRWICFVCVAACTKPSSGNPACAPGAQIDCACPGGGGGVQVCATDGRSFSDCLGCSATTNPGGGDSTVALPDLGGPGGGATDSGTDGGDRCVGIDVSADALNCGRCGHDCLGGACTNGVCQVFPLGVQLTGVDGTAAYPLITTGQQLFFASSSAPVDGGAVGFVLIPALAFDGAALYGWDNLGVYAIDPPSQKTTRLGAPPSTIFAMATSGATLFLWSWTSTTTLDGVLYAMPLAGGSATQIAAHFAVDDDLKLVAGGGFAFSHALDATGPFRVDGSGQRLTLPLLGAFTWADECGLVTAMSDHLLQLLLDGSLPISFPAVAGPIEQVVADFDTAYYVQGNLDLFAQPLSGEPLRSLGHLAEPVLRLAADDRAVYLCAGTNSCNVWKVAK